MALTVSDETWAEIERLWTETTLKPGEIGERIGVHHLVICQRAKRAGWKRLQDANPEPGPSVGADPELLNEPAAVERRRTFRRRRNETIKQRLMRLADRNLDFLEEQMESPEGLKKPEERERATKTLDAATRMIEKLEELPTNDQRAAATAGSQSYAMSGAELERRRHEIAERLERLLAARATPDGAGGAAT